MQSQGWNGCDDWDKAYEKVIERGEQYLESRNPGVFRATHLAYLALAHESKYSVYRDALAPGAQGSSGVDLNNTDLSRIDDPAAEANAALVAAVRYYTELSTK